MSEPDYLPGCFANRLPGRSESFNGFLLRLAEANAYGGIGDFLSTLLRCDRPRTPQTLARLSLQVRTDKTTLSQIGRAAAGDAHCLDQYAAQALHDEAIFAQACRIDLDALMLPHAQVCPRCLSELGIALEEWDLAPVTCCPTHRVYLVAACTKCESPLDWLRSSLFACAKCGADLRTLETTAAPARECVASEDFAALAPFRLRLEDGSRADASWDTAFRILKSLTLGLRWFRECAWPERRHFAELKAPQRREALALLAGARRSGAYDVWLLRPHFGRGLASLEAIPKKGLSMRVAFDLLFSSAGLPREIAASMSELEQRVPKPNGAQVFGGAPPSFPARAEAREFLGADEPAFTRLLRLGIVREPIEGAGYDIDELLTAQAFLSDDLLSVADIEQVAGVPLDWDDIRHSRFLPRWNPLSSLDPRVTVGTVCDLQLRLTERLASCQAPQRPIAVQDILAGCARPFQGMTVLLNELLNGRLECADWSYPYSWDVLSLDEDDLERIHFNRVEGTVPRPVAAGVSDSQGKG